MNITCIPYRYGRLLSPAEAQRHLGINASTIRTWHQRRHTTGLYPAGLDQYGRVLFYEADLLALHRGKAIRGPEGERAHTIYDLMLTT